MQVSGFRNESNTRFALLPFSFRASTSVYILHLYCNIPSSDQATISSFIFILYDKTPCIVEANVMLMLEGFAIYFCSCIIASACNSLIKFYNSLREFDKYNKLQFMGLCCHESFLELFHFQLISVYRGLKPKVCPLCHTFYNLVLNT